MGSFDNTNSSGGWWPFQNIPFSPRSSSVTLKNTWKAIMLYVLYQKQNGSVCLIFFSTFDAWCLCVSINFCIWEMFWMDVVTCFVWNGIFYTKLLDKWISIQICSNCMSIYWSSSVGSLLEGLFSVNYIGVNWLPLLHTASYVRWCKWNPFWMNSRG